MGGGRGVFKTLLEVEFKFLNYYFVEDDVLLPRGDVRGASVTFIINYGRVSVQSVHAARRRRKHSLLEYVDAITHCRYFLCCARYCKTLIYHAEELKEQGKWYGCGWP